MGLKEKTIPEGTSTQVYAAVSNHVLNYNNGDYLDNCSKGHLHLELNNDIQEKLFE